MYTVKDLQKFLSGKPSNAEVVICAGSKIGDSESIACAVFYDEKPNDDVGTTIGDDYKPRIVLNSEYLFVP